MHDPHKLHLALIKHILRYVKGTLSSGLHIGVGSISSRKDSDADWVGWSYSQHSTSRYYTYLGDDIISSLSKLPTMVSCSSAEAEYRAVAHAVAECCEIRQLL